MSGSCNAHRIVNPPGAGYRINPLTRKEMKMINLNKKTIGVLATSLIAASLSFSSAANAQSNTNVQLGVLNCTVAGGVGLILGSKKGLTCTFKRNDGSREHYSGSVKKFGLDIGVTKKSKISWIVLAPSGRHTSGALAGGYAGLSAEVTVGGGVGANLLIGGFKESITLQPLSVQVQEGFNIAAGIGSMSLHYVGN